MSRAGRTALALAAAAVALVVLAWFDTTVVGDAARQGAQSFDNSQYFLVASLGTVASAGAVLLLALLAWRSRSAVVGVIYTLLGAYFAFQAWIWATVAPELPDQLASIANATFNASVGSLNAVGIIGGGMLIVGVAVLTRSFRERTDSSVPR